MKPTPEEVGRAVLEMVGTLALLADAPFHVPFADNVNRAYHGMTPEIRKELVRMIYGIES